MIYKCIMIGLKNSKCFVAVISRRALDRVRDEAENHMWDNVLLEYETALNVSLFMRFIILYVKLYINSIFAKYSSDS